MKEGIHEENEESVKQSKRRWNGWMETFWGNMDQITRKKPTDLAVWTQRGFLCMKNFFIQFNMFLN